MADVRKVLETKINGLKVKLYECDLEDQENFERVKDYLIDKVKRSKVHNSEEYDLTYFGSKNLNPEFVEKFNAQVSKINIPKKAPLPQFDVRRERITEWMAQYLLEKEYGCTFYDEADKRMNLETVEIDKHTDGIDVPGIMINKDQLRFVICEVKASEEKSIPCSSVKDLHNDIQKAVDNFDNRVTREILQYMHRIRDVKLQEDLLNRIVIFLAELIQNAEKGLADRIIFFPFLIRNNEEISVHKNMEDFRNFSLQRVKPDNVENIILAFQRSINDFSNDIYKTAIGD